MCAHSAADGCSKQVSRVMMVAMDCTHTLDVDLFSNCNRK